MEHPLLKEFFDTAAQRLFREFQREDLQAEQAIELHRQMQALVAFEQFMQKVLTDGKMAEKENAG